MEDDIKETKKDRFFVQLRGGTEEEREEIKSRLHGFSVKSESDVDLVNIDETESEITLHIETPCGSVDLSKSDLDHDGVVEAACKSVSCQKPAESAVVESPVVPQDIVVGLVAATQDVEAKERIPTKEEISENVVSGTEGDGES